MRNPLNVVPEASIGGVSLTCGVHDLDGQASEYSLIHSNFEHLLMCVGV